ncbi:hypothetical protein EXIGLDRAFT_205973 [Exidia glandulosa HHB12029]|uniref:Uncharacterized protein n=1 Tax=Exidia glandulosa HHB12029 TaxID=1314781 RepID=A0A165MW48_EXIGL|nr:hypothetical protein EXIGLDRAFT_205973 [Exidia glandulosa HHB12029]
MSDLLTAVVSSILEAFEAVAQYATCDISDEADGIIGLEQQATFTRALCPPCWASGQFENICVRIRVGERGVSAAAARGNYEQPSVERH